MSNPSPHLADRNSHPIQRQWLGIAERARAAAAALPDEQEPVVDPVCPGDEWKEEVFREAAGESSCQQVLEGLAHWRETGQWPTLSPEAAFFLSDRLKWSAHFAELLATPPHVDAHPTAAPSFPHGTRGRDAVHWLAMVIYDRYHPVKMRRWLDRRGDDLYR